MKIVGKWWANKSIEMVEIDGAVYALDGWNGESYLNCWKCTGDYLMDASEKTYTLVPAYKETKDGDFIVVNYNVIG